MAIDVKEHGLTRIISVPLHPETDSLLIRTANARHLGSKSALIRSIIREWAQKLDDQDAEKTGN